MHRMLIIITTMFLFNLLFVEKTVFAEENNNGLMTLQIKTYGTLNNEYATLKLNVPDTWSISIDKKNDFVFKNLKAPKKIEITLFNQALYYQGDEAKNQIIDKLITASHNAGLNAAKGGKVDKNQGVENILGYEVAYCIWTLEDKKGTYYYKFLYPSNNKYLSMIFIDFKDGAPFNEAEQLINEIISSMMNSN